MTGVLEFVVSLLLHPDIKIRLQRRILTQRRKGAKKFFWSSFASLRLCVRTSLDFFSLIILDRGSFTLFRGEPFTGDAILTFNPLAQIDKLAPLRTEGTKRIIFPLDLLTAGWTFHESRSHATTRSASKRCGSLDQYSSFDECDRTFAAHGIQADGDTFTSGAHN
jgi:hypothetical protein